MSYLSYIRFDIKDGRRDEFVKLFNELQMLERPKSIDGFEWGDLAESEDNKAFIAVCEWKTPQAQTQWQQAALGDIEPEQARAFLDTIARDKTRAAIQKASPSLMSYCHFE